MRNFINTRKKSTKQRKKTGRLSFNLLRSLLLCFSTVRQCSSVSLSVALVHRPLTMIVTIWACGWTEPIMIKLLTWTGGKSCLLNATMQGQRWGVEKYCSMAGEWWVVGYQISSCKLQLAVLWLCCSCETWKCFILFSFGTILISLHR